MLKDISWEVKKGERVGLVGWNGAGKTTQLKLITGEMEPDGGAIVRAKSNMKIAFLTQEFEVVMTRTVRSAAGEALPAQMQGCSLKPPPGAASLCAQVREEFLSAFDDALRVMTRLDEVQKELENATNDMDRMGALLDELNDLQKKAERGNVYSLAGKVDKMMPTLGFDPERDNERLVASFSGGWQMRIGLGKILLQEPDLLLLDEPTNHLDVEAIEWLEQYLKSVDVRARARVLLRKRMRNTRDALPHSHALPQVPMVIVSHDREFLDQLCTKIVEVERGVVRAAHLWSLAGSLSRTSCLRASTWLRTARGRRRRTWAATATTRARRRQPLPWRWLPGRSSRRRLIARRTSSCASAARARPGARRQPRRRWRRSRARSSCWTSPGWRSGGRSGFQSRRARAASWCAWRTSSTATATAG